MGWLRPLNQIAIAVVAAGLASCTNTNRGDSARSGADVGGGGVVPIHFGSWDGRGSDTMQLPVGGASDESSLSMALSACECAPQAVARILSGSAVTHGVLPQVLVPKVRAEIANDSKLQFFNQLGGLGNLMTSLFVTDDKIASTVRDGLQDRMSTSLATLGGSSLSRRLAFRFDLFTSGVTSGSGYPSNFAILPQAARWNLVMAARNMWTNGAPIDGTDHGLQLLETMRVAAEWAYLSGVGSGGEPDGLGGLAIDVHGNPAAMAKPVNPERASESWGITASGQYTISYPQASAVDLATKIQETWAVQPNGASLTEQAMIWRAAALAFGKMRSDRLGPAAGIYASDSGALSLNTTKVPLVWLPGMAAMLKDKFIEPTTHDVFEYAFAVSGGRQKASLKSLLIASSALQEWRAAAADPSQLNLSETTKARLATAPLLLEQPVKLMVRAILGEHTTLVNMDNGTLVGVVGAGGALETDPGLVAEVVATLGWLEQTALSGPELKDRVLALYQWHVRRNLLPGGTQAMDAAALVWNLRAAEVMSQYQDAPPWVAPLRDKFRSAVAASHF